MHDGLVQTTEEPPLDFFHLNQPAELHEAFSPISNSHNDTQDHTHLLYSGPYTVPIQALPSELLTEIFENVRALASSPPLAFPVIASHVSRRWREVATMHPSFWTELVILPEDPLGRTSAYITRSQHLPLDITFDFRTVPLDLGLPPKLGHGHEGTSLESILDIIVPHSHRWRNFTFLTLLNHVDVDLIFARLTDLPAPHLESLHLFFKHSMPTRSVIFSPPTYPPLRSLFTGLTTLELFSLNIGVKPTLMEFRELVKAASSLRNLTIHGSVIELVTMPTPVIEIPSLTSLSIGLFPKSWDYLVRLLFLLQTPALESLELIGLTPDEWSTFRKYINVDTELVPPKYPVLHSLTLIDVDIHPYIPYRHEEGFLPEEDTQHGIGVWLMDALPTVTHLTLLDVDANRVLKRLIYQRGKKFNGPPLWPDLNTLSLSRNFSLDLLCGVISTRLAIGLPMAMLRLEHPFLADIPPEDAAWLKDHIHVEEFNAMVYRELWNQSGQRWSRHMVLDTLGKNLEVSPPCLGPFSEWEREFGTCSEDDGEGRNFMSFANEDDIFSGFIDF